MSGLSSGRGGGGLGDPRRRSPGGWWSSPVWPEHRGEEVGGPDVDMAGEAGHARQGLSAVKTAQVPG